ncbi:MAG: cytochrome c1 [Gammaproteobacteria bacterium]
MKRLVVILGLAGILGMFSPNGYSETHFELKAPHYTLNKATIIAGAKLFATRCMSCHSVKFMRYEFMQQDLGMSEADVEKYLMLPNGASFKGNMVSAMPPAMAHKWFGVSPPDLSQIIQYRGQDWVYTYLLSFYRDPTTPSGWNNHVFPKVAMPDVLAPWGGIVNGDGKVLKKGSESPAKFKAQVTDIVAFLHFVSDPSVFQRRAIGPWVLGLIALFTLTAYLLKRQYWKTIK